MDFDGLENVVISLSECRNTRAVLQCMHVHETITSFSFLKTKLWTSLFAVDSFPIYAKIVHDRPCYTPA